MNGRSEMKLFLIVWCCEMLSALGSGLTAFAMTAYVFEQTGNAGSPGTVLLASFLPSFLIRPVGGYLADRFDRRRIMVAGNIGSAAAMGFLYCSLFFSEAGSPAYYGGLAASSLFAGLLNPAYKASVSDLVPPALYGKAGGLNQLLSGAPLLLSPFAAGLMMSRMSIKAVLLTDIITFLASASGIYTVSHFIPLQRLERTSRESVGREIMEGFRIVFRNRGIRDLVIIISGILFFTGLLQSLLAPLVLSFETVEKLGALQSLCATGILTGGILSGVITERVSLRLQLSGALGLAGAAFGVLGLHETSAMILIPGFLFFLSLPAVNTAAEVLIRKNCDSRLQGRVWSSISFLTFAGSIAAFSLAGVLAEGIFIPLLMPHGLFAPSLGRIFGTGEGRGIALLFSLSGLAVCLMSLGIHRSSSIRKLEGSFPSRPKESLHDC